MKHYHHLSVQEVYTKLDSSQQGLSSSEATIRLEKNGLNILPRSHKFSLGKLFLGQFKNPLIYILIFAALISFITKHYTDAWIILVVTMMSVVVGFLQEYKASKALDQLRELISYKAKVIRDGKECIVKQENLVVGDIIIIKPGDRVSADARLIEILNFEVVEASLTGESSPIEKHLEILSEDTSMAERKNMVFLGTVVSRGSAKAIVTATGAETEIGQIANLLNITEESVTPLQKQITNFGKTIGITLVGINILIFSLGVFMGKPIFEVFLTSIAIIVAAVPEGLLPAMTVILAIGMKGLATEKGLVKRMLATETLGSVSVICSDKTGTLTEGEMRVTKIITESHTLDIENNILEGSIDFNKKDSYITALKISLLCNDALFENEVNEHGKINIIGNPTEKALLLLGLSNSLDRDSLLNNEPRVFELPFESEHKFMITGHSDVDNTLNSYAKGAPEKILEFSDYVDKDGKIEILTQEKKEEIKKIYESLNSTGLRVIAVSMRREDSSLENFSLDKDNLHSFVFVGLFALKDPLRSEAKETIDLCKQAGIRPIIITGDHKLTAIAIVKDLGLEVLEKNVLEGFELDLLSDEELRLKVNEVIIFARVEPKHKIRIVQALQENGEVVAMTGDGVNDAPALKKADIGIALGSGTDVAKDTADLVLLDDNFKTIVGAVKRGRGIFNNIRKVILYLLSNSFTEVLLIGLCIILNLPLALLPVQILWIKMVEDSLPSMALAFDPVDDGVMKLAPRGKNENILTSPLKRTLFFFIIIADLLLFAIFYFVLKSSGDIVYAQTIAFVGLGIASRFYMYSIRNLEKPIYRYNPFENKWVNWTTVFGFVMIGIAVYVPFFNRILHTTPLGFKDWLILVSYGFVTIVIYEIAKKIFIHKKVPKLALLNKKPL